MLENILCFRYHLSEEENDSSADELDLKKEKHVKPVTNVVAEKVGNRILRYYYYRDP